MFEIKKMSSNVRVDPKFLGQDTKASVRKALEQIYEDVIDRDFGVIISILDVEEVKDGKIIGGDAGVFYDVVFDALAFVPYLHEVIEGEVVECVNFGAFIRVGSMDGLVHVSQIMDDFVSFDEKNMIFSGKESKNILKKGDIARARIIAVSLKEAQKIGMTMRQPFLGKSDWVEKGAKPAAKEGEKEVKAKPAAKESKAKPAAAEKAEAPKKEKPKK